MHGDDIHISLAEYHIFRATCSRYIQSKEIPALLENGCIRGIQIFRSVIVHSSAAEGYHIMKVIYYRENYSPSKIIEIMYTPVLFAFSAEEGYFQFLVRKAAGKHMTTQCVKGFRSVAKPESLYCRRSNLAPLEIFPCRLTSLCKKHLMKESRRLLIERIEPCAQGKLAFVRGTLCGHLHSRALAEKLHSGGIIEIFRIHDECYDIAARAATEAMICLGIIENEKRRCLFVMKRAKTGHI